MKKSSTFRTLLAYFKAYPWQRRFLTLSLVVILGAAAGLLFLPAWRDQHLIEQLGSGDSAKQSEARHQLYALAEKSPKTLKRMFAALNDPNDKVFLGLYRVLSWRKEFGRAPVWAKDRLQAVDLRSITTGLTVPDVIKGQQDVPGPMLRKSCVFELLRGGRDNRYVRQGLAAAATDPSPRVRAAAATLAGAVGDVQTLRTLLTDSDSAVASTAARAAGVSGLSALAPEMQRLLAALAGDEIEGPQLPEMIAARRECVVSLVFGLAAIYKENPGEEFVAALTSLLTDEAKAYSREYVLWSLSFMGSAGQKLLGEEFDRTVKEGRQPDAAMLAAARRLGWTPAGAAARGLIAQTALSHPDLLYGQSVAAVQAAIGLNVNCRRAIYDLCKSQWAPGRAELLIPAAELLGREAATTITPDFDLPSRKVCSDLLANAALFHVGDPDGEIVYTPRASASAAAAYWLLNPTTKLLDEAPASQPVKTREKNVSAVQYRITSAGVLREAAMSSEAWAGDCIAWRLGRSDSAQVFALGETFFPAVGDERKEYSLAVRNCGVQMLALAAKTPEQKAAALARIDVRLARETDYVAGGTMRCAKLLLGDAEMLPAVRQLLDITSQQRYTLDTATFPIRRGLTALLVAGDEMTYDFLLLNVDLSPSWLAELLADEEMNEVFRAAAPCLPLPETSAGAELREFQTAVMQQVYAIGKTAMTLGVKK